MAYLIWLDPQATLPWHVLEQHCLRQTRFPYGWFGDLPDRREALIGLGREFDQLADVIANGLSARAQARQST